jgi:prophage DNA circulation protein
MTLPTDPGEAMTDTVRVCVVLDTRRSRIHTITGDDAEAQQTVRDLAAKGTYPLAATMTVGLVTPDAASRKRIEAAMVAKGWMGPTATEAIGRMLDKASDAIDHVKAERDQLRAELARVRAEVPTLCDAIEDEANGAFRQRPLTPLDLTAIRNAVNPKSAPTGGPDVH